MSKIYLGTIYASEDPDFFKNRNIKAVLNCSNDIPHSFKSKDIEYMRIPVEDSLKIYDYNKMYHFLNIAADFIYKHAVLQKQAILIQCFAGKQRSAISVAAFLVKYHNMTPYEACKYIMEKRPEAFHFGLSLNFEQSLQEFYKDIKKCPFKSRQPKFKST
jgi:protein-tyrosine phosphatase